MTNDIIMLKKCPYCGLENCEAHKKYNDRCKECGGRFARYSSYTSLQKKEFKAGRAKLLAKIEAEYIDLRNAGHKVPRAFQK